MKNGNIDIILVKKKKNAMFMHSRILCYYLSVFDIDIFLLIIVWFFKGH